MLDIQENNFNNIKKHISSLNISEDTVSFFLGPVFDRETLRSVHIPNFRFTTIDTKRVKIIPLNYMDIHHFHFDRNNFFLLKLHPAATKSYIFDSPLEMLYFYQAHKNNISPSDQFLCFHKNITTSSISNLLSLTKNTKIHTVFNNANAYGKLNDIRFSLIKEGKNFKIIDNGGFIGIIVEKNTFYLERRDILLHNFERLSKTRSHIKTIKPKQPYTFFKDIFT